MLTGDNQPTAERIAGILGIDVVIAEVLPEDKSAKVAELQGRGKKVAMEGTLRKMRQNLGWAIGYNAIALPIAAGVFYPAFGLMLSPEIAAISMSGSSVIVAANALLLKRLRLPEQAPSAPESHPAAMPVPSRP